jgi:hypothetical protein
MTGGSARRLTRDTALGIGAGLIAALVAFLGNADLIVVLIAGILVCGVVVGVIEWQSGNNEAGRPSVQSSRKPLVLTLRSLGTYAEFRSSPPQAYNDLIELHVSVYAANPHDGLPVRLLESRLEHISIGFSMAVQIEGMPYRGDPPQRRYPVPKTGSVRYDESDPKYLQPVQIEPGETSLLQALVHIPIAKEPPSPVPLSICATLVLVDALKNDEHRTDEIHERVSFAQE